jgi:isopenicillin-N epimerase
MLRLNVQQPHSPIEQWALSPDVQHVNHGSYGGVPRVVFEAAHELRTTLEAAPMKFLVLQWQDAIDAARVALADFIGAPIERLAFMPNATTGVAIAIMSTPLQYGDEIVVTDHGYRAVKNQLVRACEASGAKLVTARLPLPFDEDATVAAITAAVTARTRVLLLDHITSPTGLVLPIERIVRLLASRGLTVIIDGAHAAGQLALDVRALLEAGVSWYAGNNHKWLCAPKGSGFLVAAPHLPTPRPVITSHGGAPEYGPTNRLHAELDWMGTHDPTAHLTVPAAITAIAQMANGWRHAIARNHALAVEMRGRLAAALGGDVLAPDSCIGTMGAVAIELPPNTKALALEKQLLRENWEVPIVDFVHGPLVRLSAHLYNHVEQADALAEKLLAAGVRGRRLS